MRRPNNRASASATATAAGSHSHYEQQQNGNSDEQLGWNGIQETDRSNRGLTQQRQRPLPCKIRKRNIQPQQEQHTVNGCHNRHNQQQQQQQEENGGRYYPQEFPNGLFDGFDEIISTTSNAPPSSVNATLGSSSRYSIPTVSLKAEVQQQQQQQASSSSSFVTDAIRGWDNFLATRRLNRVSSTSSSPDNSQARDNNNNNHQRSSRSFYSLLPSRIPNTSSCVHPNTSYSPTLGLTIGGCDDDVDDDEPTLVMRNRPRSNNVVVEQEEEEVVSNSSSSADIPTSEWDSYMDYVTCSSSSSSDESPDEAADSNGQSLTTNEQQHKGVSIGWRQCLAWVTKASGGHRRRHRRRRRKQVRCLRKPDTHTRRIRKILRALSLVTEFDPNIYSDARLARFFVVVLLHTEYHNFSTSADIINQQPTLLLRGTKRAVALSKPRIPPSSSSSSSSSIDDQCYPSSDDNTNEDWQALGFSERDFESLGRDLNRPGSCMFALLLMIYLAVEENEAAGVVLKIIRNVSVQPAELFGLFAVNAAKWVRDICRQVNTNQRVSELFHGVGEEWYRKRNLDFDAVISWWLQSSATRVTPGFPKDIERKFIRVRRGRDRDAYGYEVLADDDNDDTHGIIIHPLPSRGSDMLDVDHHPVAVAGNTNYNNSNTLYEDSKRIDGMMRNRRIAAPSSMDLPTTTAAPEGGMSLHKSLSAGYSDGVYRYKRRNVIDHDDHHHHDDDDIRCYSKMNNLPIIKGSLSSSAASSTDSIPEEGPLAPSSSCPMSSSSSYPHHHRGSILDVAASAAAADPRVPSCHNIILWSDVMVASGSLYAYTLITFAKFWLEQDMIAASGEETNKKLNNEFIDQHFVSKLTVPRGGISGIAARTVKVLNRVKILYRKLQDEELRKLSLASRVSEKSSSASNNDVSIIIPPIGGTTTTTTKRRRGGRGRGSTITLTSSATEPYLNTSSIDYREEANSNNNNRKNKHVDKKPVRKSAPGNLPSRNSSSFKSAPIPPSTTIQQQAFSAATYFSPSSSSSSSTLRTGRGGRNGTGGLEHSSL